MVNNGLLLRDRNGFRCISMELYEKENRILRITDDITQETAITFGQDVCYLNSVSAEPITLIITSFGGSIDAGLNIIDVIENSKAPITTVCDLYAYSMAAIIISTGKKRIITPNSRVMIHSPLINNMRSGNVDRIAEISKQLKDDEKKLAQILVKYTKKEEKEIIKDFKNETFFNAKEAVKYGLSDEIKPLTEILYQRKGEKYEEL